MIEETIYDYLKTRANEPCYLMRPKTVPDKYVLIEKTGSGIAEHLTQSTFAFQSYAPTLKEAADISAEIKSLIIGLVDRGDISKVSIQNEYNFTNTTTKEPRYQLVVEFIHYEDLEVEYANS